jgi:hypothetical protein
VSAPTFITLGPAGTCHENALLHYLEFQDLGSYEIDLVPDLLDAIVRVRDEPRTFLVQCSAHVQVHLVTERYHDRVFVIDTFIYPTKDLGLIVRRDVEQPRSLGIVNATRGYLDLAPWEELVDEPSKPVVAAHLLQTSSARAIRRRADAHSSRRGTPRRTAPRRALRRGGHDLGRVRGAKALRRSCDRAAGAVVVPARDGRVDPGVTASFSHSNIRTSRKRGLPPLLDWRYRRR